MGETDLVSRQAAVDAVHKSIFDFFDICDDDEESPMTYRDEQLLEINKAITTRIKALPSAQPDRELIEQLRWERDTAIQQLKDLGYGLGEKPRTDDTISRQAAIDAHCELCVDRWRCYDDICPDLEVFQSLPSVQRWIPVSERLPEEYGQYLVTFIPSGGTLWTCVLIARYSDLMGIAKPSFHVGTVGKNDFMNITEQVTAWMPFPEPWRGKEHVPDE